MEARECKGTLIKLRSPPSHSALSSVRSPIALLIYNSAWMRCLTLKLFFPIEFLSNYMLGTNIPICVEVFQLFTVNMPVQQDGQIGDCPQWRTSSGFSPVHLLCLVRSRPQWTQSGVVMQKHLIVWLVNFRVPVYEEVELIRLLRLHWLEEYEVKLFGQKSLDSKVLFHNIHQSRNYRVLWYQHFCNIFFELWV